MKEQAGTLTWSAGEAPWPVPIRAEIREAVEPVRRALEAAFSAFGIQVLGTRDDLGTRNVLVWSLEAPTAVAAVGRLDSSVRLLALVDHPDPGLVSGLLAAGALAVFDRGDDAGTIAHAATAVARGYLVLPSENRASLMPRSLPDLLSGDELGWMQALARGRDVPSLAIVVGCSEREMYRRLRGVYRKLQVVSRADALRVLARADLLGDPR
jgi:DNA-binding NarL/FixJ family response regulator